MSILGPEPVIAAVQTALRDGLIARIDTINTTVTDGYTIDHPVDGMVYDYIPTPGQLVDAPAIGMDEGRLQWENDTGFEATGVLDLIIVAYVQHAEPEGLARVNRRYRLAIMRTILENTVPRRIEPAWGITFRGSEPGPAVGGSPWKSSDEPPHTYLTWTTLAFRCKYDEA